MHKYLLPSVRTWLTYSSSLKTAHLVVWGHKLAQILRVDEQELTDLPLNATGSAAASVNSEILGVILENVETWLDERSAKMLPKDKAELVKLIYLKVCCESTGAANEKVKNFLDIYGELRKV